MIKNINEASQYNVSVNKYKLLSSVSGCGSIITTPFCTHVLVLDINKWPFIEKATKEVQIELRNGEDRLSELVGTSLAQRYGIELIQDRRLIDFLKVEKSFKELRCLIRIPSLSLDEYYNTPNIKKYRERTGIEKTYSHDYIIPATHFPKWFKNSKGRLRKLSEWFELWQDETQEYSELKIENFAPPRDYRSYYKRNNDKKDNHHRRKASDYKLLDQLSFVLICSGGHLSDIPWSKYLSYKSDPQPKKLVNDRLDNNKSETMVDIHNIEDCCDEPRLIWIEDKIKSETISNIVIKCKSCGKSSSLEGLRELKFKCNRHKPWEVRLRKPYKRESQPPKDHHCFYPMKVHPVTARCLYYSEIFSSIFIPDKFVLSKHNFTVVKSLEENYKALTFEISKKDYFEIKKSELQSRDVDLLEIKKMFLEGYSEKSKSDKISYNQYRHEEFKVFSNHSRSDEEGLIFSDVNLQSDQRLEKYFRKICVIEELKITQVQTGFTREGSPDSPNTKIKNIFAGNSKQQKVMPAIELYGEGIFFEFSIEKIKKWESMTILEERFSKVIPKDPLNSKRFPILNEDLYQNKYSFYLIHSFAHMIMREFEFSCGYPTASLMERLYIDRNKNCYGVLIYTVEGSEGSMGGLISQASSLTILDRIIENAIKRSDNCSSDPLCWETDGQGIEGLNFAACFSCSLVSETSCEKMNLCLDRRVLVDTEFGYFKDFSDS